MPVGCLTHQLVRRSVAPPSTQIATVTAVSVLVVMKGVLYIANASPVLEVTSLGPSSVICGKWKRSQLIPKGSYRGEICISTHQPLLDNVEVLVEMGPHILNE